MAFLAAFLVAFLAAFLVAFFIDLFSVTSEFAVAARQHCDLFINLVSECCQEKNEGARNKKMFSRGPEGDKTEMESFVLPLRRRLAALAALAVLLLAALSLLPGCGRRNRAPAPPAAPSPGWTETGIASWYGNPYHGRKTSSGEVFDMNQMTAAHRTLPLGAIVKVTNLDNRRTVAVRINDRGPFVEGRIIDLSRAAAREIGLLGPGIAKVRIELTGYSNPELAKQPPLFTIQAGAFSDRAAAESYRARLRRRYEPVDVVPSLTPPGSFRIFVGRFGDQREAEAAAEQMRKDVKEVFVVRVR